MDFRLSERHSEKMNGYLFTEYKAIKIPQFDEEKKLIGFVNGKKIVGSHPIDKVLFDNSGNVVVLQFKDGHENQLLSGIEYHKLWKKKCTVINKEYDRRFPNRGRTMNVMADRLDIKAQRSE